MISIALALLLSQTGTCKTGTVCNASRYTANTPYAYLADGGVPRRSDGGVIFPFPALAVNTDETVLMAVGIPTSKLPPCPGIGKSTMQWVTDCQGPDAGPQGCYMACTTNGWVSMGSGSSAGGGGTVIAVTASSPLTSTGGSSPNIACTPANASVGGCFKVNTDPINSISGPGPSSGDTVLPNGTFFIMSQSSAGAGGILIVEKENDAEVSSNISPGQYLSACDTDPIQTPAGFAMVLNKLDGGHQGAVLWSDGTTLANLVSDARPSADRSDMNWATDLDDWIFLGIDAGYQRICTNVNGKSYCNQVGACTVTANGDVICPGDAGFAGNASIGDGCLIVKSDSEVDFHCFMLGATNTNFSMGANGVLDTTSGFTHLGSNAQAGGSQVATAANGQAGDNYCGTLALAGLSVHQSNTVARTKLQHPMVAGSTVSLTFGPIQQAGTIGGTYDVVLRDQSTATNLCSITGTSCTASSAITVDCAAVPGAAIGDVLSLLVDTSSCTGTDPVATLCASW